MSKLNKLREQEIFLELSKAFERASNDCDTGKLLQRINAVNMRLRTKRLLFKTGVFKK